MSEVRKPGQAREPRATHGGVAQLQDLQSREGKRTQRVVVKRAPVQRERPHDRRVRSRARQILEPPAFRALVDAEALTLGPIHRQKRSLHAERRDVGPGVVEPLCVVESPARGDLHDRRVTRLTDDPHVNPLGHVPFAPELGRDFARLHASLVEFPSSLRVLGEPSNVLLCACVVRRVEAKMEDHRIGECLDEALLRELARARRREIEVPFEDVTLHEAILRTGRHKYMEREP